MSWIIFASHSQEEEKGGKEEKRREVNHSQYRPTSKPAVSGLSGRRENTHHFAWHM